MTFTFLATQPNYAAHLLPIADALVARGVDVDFHNEHLPIPDEHQPVVVAGAADLSLVPADCPTALLDHGAGQVYRDVDHQSYNGGRNRGRVSLFLFGAHPGVQINQARYPAAAHVVCGPPHLDCWFGGQPTPPFYPPNKWGGTAEEAHSWTLETVAFAWHWDLPICPETGSAWAWYQPVVGRVVEQGDYRFVGTAHPRAQERILPAYDTLRSDAKKVAGCEPVADAAEVLGRADLLVADNTSLLYEAAAISIPILALDAPTYRDQPRHGLRFYDQIPGLRLRAYRDQAPNEGIVHPHWGRDRLSDAITEALEDRPELQTQRRRVTQAVYGATLDGRAAERAADAIIDWAGRT